MTADTLIIETESGPQTLYRERCKAGTIRPDPAQARAVERLEQLHRALTDYAPAPRGWLARLVGGGVEAPKGLYLWGPVGRGKSMLMDLFFRRRAGCAKAAGALSRLYARRPQPHRT